MFFLCIETFILYFPPHPSPFYQSIYVFSGDWQIRKIPKFFSEQFHISLSFRSPISVPGNSSLFFSIPGILLRWSGCSLPYISGYNASFSPCIFQRSLHKRTNCLRTSRLAALEMPFSAFPSDAGWLSFHSPASPSISRLHCPQIPSEY